MSSTIFFKLALVFLASIVLFSCVRPVANHLNLKDYEITKFRRTQISKPPVVFGFIVERQANGQSYPLEVARSITNFATITINGVSANSEATGCYMRSLAPGIHRIRLTFPGLQSINVSPLPLALGDSVRINFHPPAESASTIN